jgi:hypothetical protein
MKNDTKIQSDQRKLFFCAFHVVRNDVKYGQEHDSI